MSRSQFRDWEAVYEIEGEMIRRDQRKVARNAKSALGKEGMVTEKDG